MPSIRHIVLCTILWLTLFSANAQQLLFKNISNHLQIPSPECYNIIQDSKGYIWVGTEAGLCKFDGAKLKIFDKKNGLPEGSIYSSAEDANHVLWFSSSKNRLLKYENDELKEVSLGKGFSDFVRNKYMVTDKIFITNEQKIYFSFNLGTYIINLKTGEGRALENYPIPANFIFEKKGNSLVRLIPTNFLRTYEKTIKAVIIEENDTTEILIPKDKKISKHWRSATCSIDNIHYFSVEDRVYKIEKNKPVSILEFPGRVLSIYIDKEKGLWVGTYKNGVFYYPDINNTKSYIHSLTDCSVSGIIMDLENNIWCSSLENGILFCNNKEIIDYTNVEGLNKSIDFLKNEAGRLFVSSGTSELFEIDGGVKKHALNIKFPSTIFDIVKEDNGWIIAGSLMLGTTNSEFGNLTYLTDSNKSTVMTYDIEIVNNIMYGLSYQLLVEWDKNKLRYIRMPFRSPAKYFLHAHDDFFYVGSSTGLYLVNFKKNDYTAIKKNVSVSKVLRSKSGNIWFTTKGNGLYVLKNDSAYDVSAWLNIPTDYYYDITEDVNNNIWVGSNIGLIKIEPENKHAPYTLYDAHSGLPSNIILKVAANKEQIFFASSAGLFSLPLTQSVINTNRPYIYTHSIHINGEQYDKKINDITLPYHKNSFRFVFDAITYKRLVERTLLYKLKGRDNSFQKVVGNAISLDNLSPGKYELEVFSINNDGKLSLLPATFKFQIKKPFWQTWLFIITCAILLIVIFYLIIKKTTDNVRQKEEEKTRINKLMAEYQLSAIQAQMNPHFIFNAINSIQSYILQKNEQQAYDYLAKFSKLIRMVLNNSEEKVLSLYQELQTLDLYIQLEKLRFDNKFEYILNISEEVNPHDVLVPAMLIQPYVENAIWHGLMNLDTRPAILKINVSVEKENLFISIEDNGIGRELAAQFKKNSEHKSIGMKLNQKRLTMINQLKDFEDARVSVVDLHDTAGQATGTRIEIYVPIN